MFARPHASLTPHRGQSAGKVRRGSARRGSPFRCRAAAGGAAVTGCSTPTFPYGFSISATTFRRGRVPWSSPRIRTGAALPQGDGSEAGACPNHPIMAIIGPARQTEIFIGMRGVADDTDAEATWRRRTWSAGGLRMGRMGTGPDRAGGEASVLAGGACRASPPLSRPLPRP